MNLRALSITIICSGIAFGQAVRVDPTPTTTVSGNVPPGAYAPLLAVPGSTIGLCQNAGCSSSATSYTDATAATPCPSSAPVVTRGTAVCSSTSDYLGNFGFWVLPGLNYWYTVTFPAGGGTYGPFPFSASGTGGGGGGGTPGLPSLSLQYNCAGSFCGASGAIWNATTNVLTLTAAAGVPALTVVGGYVMTAGGLAATGANNYNSIQSASGGTAVGGFFGLSGTFVNYTQVGSYAGTLATGPPTSTGDTITSGISYSVAGGCFAGSTGGAWACITGSGSGANTALSNLASVNINTALLFQTNTDIGSSAKPPRNIYFFGGGTYGTDYFELTGTSTAGRTWTFPDVSATVAGTSGTLTNGHCVSINSSALLVDAGGACTTGGGGGTVTSSTNTFIPYYNATGTVIAGQGDFTYVVGSHSMVGGASAVFDLHSASAAYLPGSLTTGPVKVTTSTGALSTAVYTDIAALWVGTGCGTATNALLVNGNCAAGSGITGINSQTGPTIAINGTTNEVTVGSVGNVITIGTVQNICTTCTVAFGSTSVTGLIVFGAGVGSGLVPSTPNTFALGTSTNQWQSVWANVGNFPTLQPIGSSGTMGGSPTPWLSSSIINEYSTYFYCLYSSGCQIGSSGTPVTTGYFNFIKDTNIQIVPGLGQAIQIATSVGGADAFDLQVGSGPVQFSIDYAGDVALQNLTVHGTCTGCSATMLGVGIQIAPSASGGAVYPVFGSAFGIVQEASPMPRATVIGNLYVNCGGSPPSGGTAIYTLYKNGVATSLSVTLVSSVSTGSNTSATVSFSAGDTASIEVSGTATNSVEASITMTAQ